MTSKQQFRKIQKQIMIILNKIEKEAVENGEDISTSEFQAGLLELKKKLLERSGITLEEYNSTLQEENKVKTAKVEEEKKKIEESMNKKTTADELLLMELAEAKGLKGSKGEKGDKGDKGDKGEMGELGKQGESGLKGEKGDRGKDGLKGDRGESGEQGLEGKTGKDGKTLLMPNIKKVVIKQLDEATPEIIKAVVKDSADLVMKNPSLVNMPAFRAMGMGLRGDIDKLEIEKITGINTHKITVGTTQPTSPSIGDLWIDTT